MDLVTSIPPKISRFGSAGEEYGLLYTKKCIESWRSNGFDVSTLNRESEAEEIIKQFGIKPIIFEDERDALFKDRFGPSFREILRGRDPRQPMCIANADVFLLQSGNLAAQLERLCEHSFLFAHRTDHDAEFKSYSNYKIGVDFVAFRPDRLARVFDDEGFGEFKMGLVWWDYVLPIAASFHMPILRIREPFILHQEHGRGWDEGAYREMRSLALETLRRLAGGASHSSAAAALFAEHSSSLDLTGKQGGHDFFQLCTDWLAGRLGPVKQIELSLDADRALLTEMLRSVLEDGTRLNIELEAERKSRERLERQVAKREKDRSHLKLKLKEARSANKQLQKRLSISLAKLVSSKSGHKTTGPSQRVRALLSRGANLVRSRKTPC